MWSPNPDVGIQVHTSMCQDMEDLGGWADELTDGCLDPESSLSNRDVSLDSFGCFLQASLSRPTASGHSATTSQGCPESWHGSAQEPTPAEVHGFPAPPTAPVRRASLGKGSRRPGELFSHALRNLPEERSVIRELTCDIYTVAAAAALVFVNLNHQFFPLDVVIFH